MLRSALAIALKYFIVLAALPNADTASEAIHDRAILIGHVCKTPFIEDFVGTPSSFNKPH